MKKFKIILFYNNIILYNYIIKLLYNYNISNNIILINNINNIDNILLDIYNKKKNIIHNNNKNEERNEKRQKNEFEDKKIIDEIEYIYIDIDDSLSLLERIDRLMQFKKTNIPILFYYPSSSTISSSTIYIQENLRKRRKRLIDKKDYENDIENILNTKLLNQFKLNKFSTLLYNFTSDSSDSSYSSNTSTSKNYQLLGLLINEWIFNIIYQDSEEIECSCGLWRDKNNRKKKKKINDKKIEENEEELNEEEKEEERKVYQSNKLYKEILLNELSLVIEDLSDIQVYDAHCHLHFSPLTILHDEILSSSLSIFPSYPLLSVCGVSPGKDWNNLLKLKEKELELIKSKQYNNEKIYLSFGLHPWYIKEYYNKEVNKLRRKNKKDSNNNEISQINNENIDLSNVDDKEIEEDEEENEEEDEHEELEIELEEKYIENNNEIFENIIINNNEKIIILKKYYHKLIKLLKLNSNYHIGEIGIEKNKFLLNFQLNFIINHLYIASKYNKIISLHIGNGCWLYIYQILKDFYNKINDNKKKLKRNLINNYYNNDNNEIKEPHAIILHCCNSLSPDMLKSFLVFTNVYYSFTANIKERKKGQPCLAELVPIDRILVESDSPDQLPPCFRKKKIINVKDEEIIEKTVDNRARIEDTGEVLFNHPLSSLLALYRLSIIRNINFKELVLQVEENSKRVFRIT